MRQMELLLFKYRWKRQSRVMNILRQKRECSKAWPALKRTVGAAGRPRRYNVKRSVTGTARSSQLRRLGR